MLHGAGYNLPETMPALFQPDGGMLNPEACVAAHTALAMQHGAEARFGEAVASWSADKGGSGVTVRRVATITTVSSFHGSFGVVVVQHYSAPLFLPS